MVVIDDLVIRAQAIRGLFFVLAKTPSRRNAFHARKLLAEYDDIRDRLITHNRIIDPITL